MQNLSARARQSVTLLSAVTAVLVLSLAAPAAGQSCTSLPASSPTANTHHYVEFTATTTQTNCAPGERTTRTEGWIEGSGQYMYCAHTQVTGGQYCIRESTTGNAQVTLSMDTVCNGWAGLSNHMYKNPNDVPFTGIPQNMPRLTSLWSYCTPAEECADQGADYYWDGGQCVYTPGSPIIVSTRKDAKYKLTSVADGVWFDIDGDGVPEQVAWTQPESDVSFLAIDVDGDGKISSGRELFGNHTIPGASNGFIALLQMTMANGGTSQASVSSDDPIFARLLLWTDNNHNGISEQWELRRASDVLSAVGQIKVKKSEKKFRFSC